MEDRVSIHFLLKTHDTLICRAEKVEGDEIFCFIPKVVQDNEMVGMDPVKPSVQRYVGDDFPLKNLQKFFIDVSS